MNKSLILVAFLLSSCAHVKPYAEVGIAYQFDKYSDYISQTERSWNCNNPQLDVEVGIETRSHWQLGVHHTSWVNCGSFNNKPETYSNDIRINKKFWGWRHDH